jgi:CRISPR-associated protein Cas2
MYVILVYDVGQKRVGKMLKLCRKYLNRVQNSVLEGEITEARLQELLLEAKAFFKPEEDSIIVFRSRNAQWLEKQIVGRERMTTDHFL